MKKIGYLILVLFSFFFSIESYSQVNGDYRSAVATGGWETAASWERFDGTSWVAASSFPLYSIPNTVTVLSGHNLTINGDPAFGSTQTYVPNTIVTGTITIASGKTLWVANTRTFTVNGTLVNNGTSLQVQSGTASIIFNGVYQHAVAAGTIPTATWSTGSTCNVTGSTGAAPSGTNQNFYNFIWNCTGQNANLTLGWNGNIIGGDVTITETKGFQLRVNSTTGTTTTINGSLIINGATAYFTTTGSSSVAVTVNINGSILLSAGTFSLSNSSSAIGTWNLKGNLDMTGSPATGTFRSSSTSSILYFIGNISQLFSMPSSGATISVANIQVNTGAILNLASTTVFGSSGNFIVQTGATLGVANVGGIAGSITTTGTKTYSTTANYTFNGTSSQITSSSLPATVNNLTISNANGVSLSNAVTVSNILAINAGTLATGVNNLILGASASATIAPNATLSISGGTTDFANRPVTLQSSASGTARIASITGDNVANGLINASNVTVQRYIPGNRRTSRFLGHPFSNTLTMGRLVDNIYITGDGTIAGTGGATTGAGFDATSTNAASSFWFDNGVAQSWKAFADSADASWTQYRGVRVLVRGDRTQPTALTGANPTPNAVTLDMTGAVNTGSQTIAVPFNGTAYSVFGNPYPSPVDLGTRLFNTPNIGTQYWVWDANAGPTSGAYVVKTVTPLTVYNLPMSGAFVVQPTGATSIAFVEGDKQSTATANLFRTNTLSGQLELQLLYNNYPADNMFVRFNTASNDNKESLDGGKLLNPEVNFYALSADNKKLSLDTRPFAENKIIPLGFTATAANSFKIKVADYGINEDVYLKDKFLNTLTKLDTATEYSFSVNPSIPATLGENRFELVMKANSALPTTFLSVTAAQKNAGIEVSFSTANEINMASYEVEESVDGVTFTKATTLEAMNKSTNNYTWFDGTVINGNNYYRIKSVEKNGASKYSNVVKVKMGGKASEFTVYPNPVKGGVVSLQMSNLEKGIYIVRIFNNVGQELANKTINHNGGSATQTIVLGKSIPTGTYNMQISIGTKVITKTVVVE